MDKQEHSISRYCGYGELKLDTEPDYIQARLNQLYTEAEPILDRTLSTAISVKKNHYREYTPETARKKKKEALLEPRLNLHKVLRSHLEQVQQGKERIKNKIKSYSIPKKQTDPSDQLAETLLLQEIRSLLRNEPDFQKRKEIVEQDIIDGGGSYLRACSSSPDKILPGESLLELQRQLAFKENPDLELYERQVDQQATVIRKKCAELNSSQRIILEKEHLEDVLSKEEHFKTFKPEDDYQQGLADVLILAEKRMQKQQDSKEEFNVSHPGVNMN